MPLRVVGTTPQEFAPENKKRGSLVVQVIPSSIVAGNTGLVFGKFGSAPVANLTSGTWDFVLSQGASDGTNLYETRDRAILTKSLWLVSDTASQQVNVTETTLDEVPSTPTS